jgi:hypothetical protein
MNVISMSTNLYRLAFQIFTNSTQIIVQFIFNDMINQRFPVFGAEHDVEVIGYEGLSHVNLYYAPAGLFFLFDGLHPSLLDFTHSGLVLLFHYSMGYTHR